MSESATVDRKHQIPNAKTAPLWAVLVVVAYFFSGVVALSYEVMWARLLSLQFGVSIFGVVVTVAAFMAGLGAGSLLGVKIPRRFSPFLILALIEISVAVLAILLPSLFSIVDGVLSPASGELSLGAWYSAQFSVALIVLFIPAVALGVGFPLVLRILENQSISLGMVYGVNALGGFLGALLPLFGLVTSLYAVAAIGIAVGVGFIWLSRQAVDGLCKQERNKVAGGVELSNVCLMMYGLIGAGSLILQIGWTRLYGMLLLRTEYVMAIILAVFLLGMAVGSVALRSQRSNLWLTVLPILAAFGALISLWALPWVADYAATGEYASLWEALVWQGLCVALFTIPVTFALGAWLPILAGYFRSHGYSVGARFYGANAIGSALGTLLAGFVLFPLVGSAGVIALAATLLLMAGLYFSPIRKKAMLAVVPLVLLLEPVFMLPSVSVLLPATLAETSDLYLHEDAVSITHVVEQADGQRLLLGDLQRMDASSDPTAVASQQNQTRLPLLLHPEPESILFLGVGTAISVSGSMAYENLKRVGVELSQGAIEASRQFFSPVNESVVEQGLVTLVRDDARRYLKTTTDKFDVIVGDLFHPDLVGRSALLSLEQFERAKTHLEQEGVFVQWLALNQFDSGSLDVVLRTFAKVFSNAHIFVDGFRVAMVGLNGDQSGSATAVMANLARLNEQQVNFATGGEGGWTWLGRYFGRIDVQDGSIQRELMPVIEYELPRARYTGDLDVSKTLQMLLLKRPSVEEAAKLLAVPRDSYESFERSYMAVELGVRSWVAAVNGRHGEAERLVRIAYSANPKDRWIGFDLADRMFATLERALRPGLSREMAYQRILDIRPDHEGALRGMLRLAKQSGDEGRVARYHALLKEVSPLARDL